MNHLIQLVKETQMIVKILGAQNKEGISQFQEQVYVKKLRDNKSVM